MMWLVGVGPFLLVHLPITMLAASIGVWLFFVQHQFEETYWEGAPAWSLHEAALHGSSHYDLPGVLRWLTANIGVHHVHHLSSRIPYYRLPRVLHDHPELKGVGRLTLLESFACVRLVLWDESNRRLISFRDLRRSERAQAAVTRRTAPRRSERPVLLLHLDEVDEDVLAPEAGPFGEVVDDAPEELLLLLDGARVADGELNQHQIVRVGDAEIARRVDDLGLRRRLP